jgi:hypothetical protein
MTVSGGEILALMPRNWRRGLYFPASLQKGMQVIISPLMKICGACTALGCTPLLGRAARVSFIPKPACTGYVKSKFFHLVSTVTYFLKTLVRPVDEMEPL